MNTNYEKELNRICLHVHKPEIYEEDYQMSMLRQNDIPGLLEVNGCGIDGESRYTYEVTGLVSMAVLFENKQVRKSDIEQFVYCLLETTRELRNYMLNPGCLLLDPEYIFCKKQTYFFCYLPGKTQELCESFHHMTEYFVKKLDYEDEQGITLAYELHKATLQENYDLYEIMKEYREEYEAEDEEEIPEETQEWEEQEDTFSDMAFQLESEEDYEPMKDTEVIKESGGVWSAWKKAAHKIGREQEDTFSDMAFQLESEEDYEPMKDTEVIKESGGVWSAWKKAAHKIGRGRLGRWGSWDDLILETDGQDESSHL